MTGGPGPPEDFNLVGALCGSKRQWLYDCIVFWGAWGSLGNCNGDLIWTRRSGRFLEEVTPGWEQSGSSDPQPPRDLGAGPESGGSRLAQSLIDHAEEATHGFSAGSEFSKNLVQCSLCHLLKRPLFLYCVFLPPYRLTDHIKWGFISGVYSVSWSMCLFLCQYHIVVLFCLFVTTLFFCKVLFEPN